MSYKTEWESGQHNMVCQICQAVFKSRYITQDWRGLWVCDKDKDPRPLNMFYKLPPITDPRPVQEVTGSDPNDLDYYPPEYDAASWPAPTP